MNKIFIAIICLVFNVAAHDFYDKLETAIRTVNVLKVKKILSKHQLSKQGAQRFHTIAKEICARYENPLQNPHDLPQELIEADMKNIPYAIGLMVGFMGGFFGTFLFLEGWLTKNTCKYPQLATAIVGILIAGKCGQKFYENGMATTKLINKLKQDSHAIKALLAGKIDQTTR